MDAIVQGYRKYDEIFDCVHLFKSYEVDQLSVSVIVTGTINYYFAHAHILVKIHLYMRQVQLTISSEFYFF